MKGKCHLQVVLVDVPLGSVSARNVWVSVCSQLSQGIPPFLERQLTEDSEGGGIKAGSSENRGRFTSVTDNFRIVIKGDGICDEIGAKDNKG